VTTTWRKMESWRPCSNAAFYPPRYAVTREDGDEVRALPKTNYPTRLAALRAANAANRRDGLPEVE